MNRIFLLFAIGAATFFILLLANNPDLFNDIWLYLIGLAGGVIKLFKLLVEKLKSFSKDLATSTAESKQQPLPSPLIQPVEK